MAEPAQIQKILFIRSISEPGRGVFRVLCVPSRLINPLVQHPG